MSRYDDDIEPTYTSKSTLKVGTISTRLLISLSSLGLELS
ncbi:hypothetical protein CCUS01_15526 [Colletotrichum cuscutae]|uniref:Uncharacterized protein n=1 Tax=Colletotrichum cuscutae TaxID=1209917 RepID=A0AAI9VDS9_9PEZI|nr:hypothetical protein CCUS01_15526 [Colletotrichum cuscutae]